MLPTDTNEKFTRDAQAKIAKLIDIFRDEYESVVLNDNTKSLLKALKSGRIVKVTKETIKIEGGRFIHDIKEEYNNRIKVKHIKNAQNNKEFKGRDQLLFDLLHHKVRKEAYENPLTLAYAKQLIEIGNELVGYKFNKKSVMYIFIMTLKNDEKNIYCKIGFTEDYIKRKEALQNEYSCDFFLVGLKRVKGESAEKDFHAFIKKSYAHLNVNLTVNGKRKDEVYKLDKKIVESFDAIKESKPNPKDDD